MALVSAIVRTRSHAVLNATWHASLHANFLSAAALCVHGPGAGTGRERQEHTPPCATSNDDVPDAARLTVLLPRELGAHVYARLVLRRVSVREHAVTVWQREVVLLQNTQESVSFRHTERR